MIILATLKIVLFFRWVANKLQYSELWMVNREKVFLETAKLKNLNSGFGQFCLHLGKALDKYNDTFDFTYFVPKEYVNIFGSSNNYVTSSRWRRITGIPSTAAIWHCFHQGTPYWPRQKKTKVVLTVHDLNFTIKYSGWKRIKETTILQRQVEKADKIIAISDYTRNEILKNLEVDPKKLSVIYNGATKQDVEKKKPLYMNGQKFFLSVGIISAKKNVHVLLPLLKSFQGSLVLAGNNSSAYAKHIIDQARKMGIGDRVILPGEISEAEKLWLYANCEAFLFPSLAEGFGLPVVEAMNEGKPVFCSDQTSLPEIGGPHAYYFNDFDPGRMAEVLSSGLYDYNRNPGKKHAIIRWAERFSWDSAAKQYLELYQSLLN